MAIFNSYVKLPEGMYTNEANIHIILSVLSLIVGQGLSPRGWLSGDGLQHVTAIQNLWFFLDEWREGEWGIYTTISQLIHVNMRYHGYDLHPSGLLCLSYPHGVVEKVWTAISTPNNNNNSMLNTSKNSSIKTKWMKIICIYIINTCMGIYIYTYTDKFAA